MTIFRLIGGFERWFDISYRFTAVPRLYRDVTVVYLLCDVTADTSRGTNLRRGKIQTSIYRYFILNVCNWYIYVLRG